MENLIIIAVLVAIVAGSVFYLWRSKKNGNACVGCPSSKSCGGKCCGGCAHTDAPASEEHASGGDA